MPPASFTRHHRSCSSATARPAQKLSSSPFKKGKRRPFSFAIIALFLCPYAGDHQSTFLPSLLAISRGPSEEAKKEASILPPLAIFEWNMRLASFDLPPPLLLGLKSPFFPSTPRGKKIANAQRGGGEKKEMALP